MAEMTGVNIRLAVMSEKSDPPIYIRPEIRAVPAYRQGAVPTTPGFKLSSNENPFPPQPAVVKAVAEAPLSRYAAPAMPALRAAIGAQFGFDDDTSQARVHLGAGSVSILFQLVQAVAGPGDEVVFAWPSFEAYPLLGIASGATSVRVPLTDTAEHDLEAMSAAVTGTTRAVLLCSPNNPTGPIITRDAFREFMASIPSDVLVVLDEAYREFVTDPDAVRGEDEIHRYENLAVLRTFSKAYGLAALRIGYGIGHPAIWEAARVTGIPLSISPQAERAALAALEPETREAILSEVIALADRRDALAADLRSIGYSVPHAQGNYVWLDLGERASALGERFAAEGILVRPFPDLGVRISVGEPESIPEVLRIATDFQAQDGR